MSERALHVMAADLLRLQVLEDYALYGDAMLGRFGARTDGTPSPNVRTLVKPLLNLFHGERGCKRWKQAVDAELKSAVTVSGLLQVRGRLWSAARVCVLA